MPSATEQRRWIRSSVNDWLLTTFPSVSFDFLDHRRDLDKALASASLIVTVDYLRRSHGPLSDVSKVTWPLQLTVISKHTADPHGTERDGVVSQLIEGLKEALIPVKDYTDPALPTNTSHRLRVLSLDDDDIGEDDVIGAVAITAELLYYERP